MVNLQERILDGSLCAQIEVVVSSSADAAGVALARALGLPVRVVERHRLADDEFQRTITEATGEVDLVCMAGFLFLWKIPAKYEGRVINIHPALLPDFGGKGFYGRRVHEAVLKAGRAVSGCTVHYCDNEYDQGAIILQRTVAVRPEDTPDALAARVFAEEREAYPETIRMIASGQVRYEGGRVVFADSAA